MKTLLLTAILFAFFSCNSGNQQSEVTEPNDHHSGDSENMSAEKAGETELLSNDDLEKFQNISAGVADQLVDAYLQIKDALVNTDGPAAQKAAETIHKNLASTEDEGVSLIREDIKHISNTESVEHQREHFNELSKHIYAMIKSQENVDMTLYRQYCPMAFKNTGAFWISSSEEIRNPYFGDKMLKCGRVEETISVN